MPASFTRLPHEDLNGLAASASTNAARGLADFLAKRGTSTVKLDVKNNVFSALLPILTEEYDIDLETSENEIIADLAEACEALVFILTPEERKKYLTRLSPDQFSASDLNDAYEDFFEEKSENAGKAMLACITTLYQALLEVDDDHVIVVMVSSS